MQRFMILGLFGLIVSSTASAQDSKKEMLTLSKGKYVEVFDQDSIEHVGNILYNVNTQQIIGFADDQATTAAAMMKPEVISRWLSVDPLAEKFASMSPYCAMGNNPVLYSDPDGRAFIIGDGSGPNKYDKQFFNMLNARSGNVFQMDKKGNVGFAEGKSLADVKDGKGVSSELAKAVAAGFAPGAQDVNFRGTGKSSFDFDQFSTGKVDVTDLKNVDESAQAAMMGHFITERYATDNYEANKGTIISDYDKTEQAGGDVSTNAFSVAHQAGKVTETAIISQQTGIQVQSGFRQIDGPAPLGDPRNPSGARVYLRYSNGVELQYDRDNDRNIIRGSVVTGQ